MCFLSCKGKVQPQTKTKSLPDGGGAFNPHVWEAEAEESL